jgi:cytochrome c biogenesis protein CcmG/thiol:disulfide interchange protein DsbE
VKNKAFLFLVIGILAALLAISFTLEMPGSGTEAGEVFKGGVESGSVSVNSQAPGFTLPDHTGQLNNLDDYQGKIVILNFWATWCTPCREEMPLLDEYAARHAADVVVIGVAVDATAESVISFLGETPVRYPILIDENGMVAAAYHVAGYPMTYFLDAAGIIRGKYIGTITPRVLQQNLTPLGINE